MANLILEQQPKYDPFPVTQPVIFTVSDSTVVANQTRVKLIANIYIDVEKANLGTAATKIATLKTTPNNVGVGMFDLRPILESYVNSDNLASGNTSTNAPVNAIAPTYKGASYSLSKQFPIHVIDKFALSENTIKWLSVKFQIEYLDADATQPNVVTTDGDFLFTPDYLFYNGYLSHTDNLTGSTFSSNFGWNLEKAGYALDGSDISFIQNSNTSNYLTPCPKELFARSTDYGTLATFNILTNASFETGSSGDTTRKYSQTQINMYDASDSLLVSFNIDNNYANGGCIQTITNARGMIIFSGVYPANLNNWSTDFQTHIGNTSYYTIKGLGSSGLITAEYRINIICANSFGYEGIQLTWLNKFGTWDYYTFNQKSVRSLNTTKSQYTQLGGTWNQATYQPHGYKGGMKNFRVNAKESIKLNTDYLNDLQSEWMEGLFNSPEVYILTGETTTDNAGLINKYLQPVILSTTGYTRKTVANDKLIQYTIDVERNKELRTQTV